VYLDNINIGDFANVTESENLNPIIYPNPVKAGDFITLEIKEEFNGYLVDQNGSKISIYKGNKTTNLSIPENLATGLYTLQIQTGTKIWNKRIAIVK
jgi:hypothetical protein